MINIKVLYFARLKEALGIGEEALELPGEIDSVSQLKQFLAQRGGPWQQLVCEEGNYLVSINQEFAIGDQTIQSGDEVAFFPPVTGG